MRRGDILGSGPGTVDRACRASGRRARDDGEDVRRRVGGRSARARVARRTARSRGGRSRSSSSRRFRSWRWRPTRRGRVRGVDGGDARRPDRARRRRGRVRYGCGRGCLRARVVGGGSVGRGGVAGPLAVPRVPPASRRTTPGRRPPRRPREISPATPRRATSPTSPRPPPCPIPRPSPRPRPRPTPRRTISGCSRFPTWRRAGRRTTGSATASCDRPASATRATSRASRKPRRAPSPRASPPRPPPKPPPSRRRGEAKAGEDKKIPSLRDFKTDLQAKAPRRATPTRRRKKKSRRRGGEGERAAAADPTRSRPDPQQTQRRARGDEGSERPTDRPAPAPPKSAPDAIPADVEPVATPDATRVNAARDDRDRGTRSGHHDGAPSTSSNPPRQSAFQDARRAGDEGRRATRRDGRAFGARRVGGVVGIRLGLVREVSRRGVARADGDARANDAVPEARGEPSSTTTPSSRG